MNPIRRQRLIFVSVVFAGVAVASLLALYGLRQNINLFLTPTQVATENLELHQHFRLGGIVAKGSLQYGADKVEVRFLVTDGLHSVPVAYHGLLPNLFHEGQGVVAEGVLNAEKTFVADQVLAKHDRYYQPMKRIEPGAKTT